MSFLMRNLAILTILPYLQGEDLRNMMNLLYSQIHFLDNKLKKLINQKNTTKKRTS